MRIWQSFPAIQQPITRRLFGGTLLFARAVTPCSVSHIPRLWSKRLGAPSKLFAFERDGLVGFIDPLGKVVIQPTIPGPIEYVGDFEGGLARVKNLGYIDEEGRWLLKGKHWYVEDFAEGIALVGMFGQGGAPGSTLFIDRQGKEVLRLPGSYGGRFSENLLAYELRGRQAPGPMGFLDRHGRIAIKPVFADVGPFVGGLARAVSDGRCHVVLPHHAIRPPLYMDRRGSPTTGYASDCGDAPDSAVLPCRAGFINRVGAFVIPPRFEAVDDFQEGMAAVRVKGRWGFINRQGSVVIPPIFDFAQPFCEGLAGVMVGKKWGFVDSTGRMVIAPRFEGVDGFSEGLAAVSDNHHLGFIDRRGNTKITGPYKEIMYFVHGLAPVLTGDHHVAYVKPDGTTVFEYERKLRG